MASKMIGDEVSNSSRIAELIQNELTESQPFGIREWCKGETKNPALGAIPTFSGVGSDGNTIIEVRFISSVDDRTVDAFSCSIERGDQLLSIRSYLLHFGLDSSAFQNLARIDRESFIKRFVRNDLGGLTDREDLASALSGGRMVEVPFDYGDTR